MGGVEGLVGSGVAEEHLRIDPLVARVAPAFDRAAVGVGGEPEGGVAGLPAPQPVGIAAFARREEGRCALRLAPEPVQGGAHPGELLALPSRHLRLGPVEAVDLGGGGAQGGEVAVEAHPAPLLLDVVVSLDVLANLGVPVSDPGGCEDSTDDRAAAPPDPVGKRLRDLAGSEVGECELGDGSTRLGFARNHLHLAHQPIGEGAEPVHDVGDALRQLCLHPHDRGGDIAHPGLHACNLLVSSLARDLRLAAMPLQCEGGSCRFSASRSRWFA